jgi:hypothetical protein
MILTALTSAAMAIAFAHPQTALAINPCPTDVDMCVFVNSNLDNDLRDDAVTLREALLLANGSLTLADLTIPELGQVVITMPPGWGPPDAESLTSYTPPGFGGPGGIGKTSVQFDRTVFCVGCLSNTISLDPVSASVDQGLKATSSGGTSVALPVLAPKPGSEVDVDDWQVRIGDAGGGVANLSVNIDGSRLGTTATGLALEAPGVTMGGVTLQRFPGTAISLTCSAAAGTAMDVNFAENGTDIATGHCWSDMP